MGEKKPMDKHEELSKQLDRLLRGTVEQAQQQQDEEPLEQMEAEEQQDKKLLEQMEAEEQLRKLDPNIRYVLRTLSNILVDTPIGGFVLQMALNDMVLRSMRVARDRFSLVQNQESDKYIE